MSSDICAVCGAPFTPDANSRIRICPACRDFYGLVSPGVKAKRRRQEHEGAEQGYAAVICTGWEAAKATLENYLSKKREKE